MSIRTDSNRNPSAIANIASDVITLNNYQVPSNVYAVAPNATHTFQTMSESNLDVSHSLFTNTGIESAGLESTHLTIAKGTITGSGNSAVINTLRGNLMSLSSLSGQNGQVANVQNVLLRNLNVSSYMYANSYTLPSISLSNGNGTFSKNVDVYGALQSNIVASNTLQASDVENRENVIAKDGNITNNMTTSNLLGTGFSIVNNSASFSNQVDMDGVSTITTLASNAMTVENETNQGAISQKNASGSTLAYLTPAEITMAGTAEVMDESTAEHKIVRRFADVINGVFEDDLNVTTLFASVDGISLLNSNAVNISDTLYVSSQYNHTTNDINTNGNLILTTNSAIATNVNITNAANINRRVFNSNTVSGNAVYADALFINQSAKMGNLNAGRVEAGSYNALRRITTTGNVESNVLTSNRLTGSGEFIFNANVDVNTLQAVDMNLNNTTIAFISSNSAGGNIDMANLNSYITSNVITGYTTANIISGNVVQDVVVGNVLANVKVGEVVVGNIYLGNILTEIIVSNTTANLIVGNLSTFLEIGNTVANVVVGNISSNILVGNIEVIGIVGNISSNVITGNISSNIITGYTESNVIVGNTESQVFVGQTTTQVISGYTVENVITGNTTANVIIGTYEEEVLIGNTVANVIVGNVTANVISGYELANVIVGNVYANVVVGNITANIVVGNILGNIVIGNIEQTLVVGNTVGNGIVGNVYQSVVVGNIELSNVIVGNTVVPNVVIGNVITENVIIGNIVVPNVVIGNTYTTGVTGNIVGAGNANLNISNLTLSSVAITPVSVSSIWGDLTSGNLNGNIVVSKNIGTVSLPYSANSSSNIAASTFFTANFSQQLSSVCWSEELNLFVAGAYNGPSGKFVATSPDGITWTQRNSTADANWQSVCWSAETGLFVMVAQNRVATSPDGINWTARSCPTGAWYNVIWVKEKSLFVSVAWAYAPTNKAVMTSPDGITWTAQTTPNNNQWMSVTYSPSLNLFVAVSGATASSQFVTSCVMTSPDAINWTMRTGAAAYRWYYVAWSPTLGIFAAVARTSSTNSVMTSTDGINWTSRTTPNMSYNTIIWIPEQSMFVAVTSGGSYAAIYSKDGVNWSTLSNSNLMTGEIYGITWAPKLGRLCIVSTSTTASTVMYATASVVSSPASGNVIETNYFLGNIISSNILIGNILTENVIIGNTTANVIVGNVITENVIVGNIITTGIVGNITSTVSAKVYDGNVISGNLISNAFTSANITQQLYSVAWSPELALFAATAYNGPTGYFFLTSPDGSTWTQRVSTADTLWTSICWSAELGLFVAIASGRVATSPDGINWTARTCPSGSWYNVIWSKEKSLFVAVAWTGAATNSAVMTSPDGITWTSRTTPNNFEWQGVTWSPELNLFVAVAGAQNGGGSTTNNVMTSPDAITWTLRDSGIYKRWYSVAWSPKLGLFCAVGRTTSTSSIMTSPNGINWTLRNNPENQGYNYVVWVPDYSIFIAVAAASGTSYAVYSANGVDWYSLNTGSISGDFYGAAWAPAIGTFCAVNNVANAHKSMRLVETGSITNLRNFTYTTPSYNRNFRSVCWAPELLTFVAVASFASTQTIMTSTRNSGTTWLGRVAPNSNTITSVCWSSKLGLFVTVASSGSNNRVNTSTDGMNWTAQTSIVNNSWSSVCWSPQLSLFVAVATNVSPVNAAQLVMTSSDGITWTIRDSYNGGSWSSVCWSPQLSLFVAVSSTGGHVMISSNGTTWTRYAAASSNAWTSVCWAPELNLFVAVANSGTNNRVMTSPDGITWTSRKSAANYAWSSITWAGDIKRFYVVCEDTNNVMMVSQNAIDWYSIPTTFNTFSAITWAPELGRVCAVSSLTTTSNRILTHTTGAFIDSRNFSLSTVNTFNILNNMNAYDWSGNLFVGVGSGSSNVIVSSPNGSTWTDQTTVSRNLYDKNWTSLAWSPSLNLYCAVASTGTGYRVMTSPDGTNWTPISTPADNNWTSVCWAPELSLFVAVASSGTGNRVMTSPNGSTWTLRTSAADNNWTSVTWAPSISRLCAVASSGTGNRVMTSSDGITWTIRTSPADNTWNSIAWSPSLSLFCAVASTGTNNRIMTSPDGITWTTRNTNYNDFSWNSVIWAPEISKFYVTSTGSTLDNVIATSSNGINWLLTYPPTDVSYSWNSLAWSPTLGELYGVGKNSNGNISTLMSTNSMISGNTYIGDELSGNISSFSYTSGFYGNISTTNSITWSPKLKLFGACGISGKSEIATSSNGTSWAIRSTGLSGMELTNICWSEALSMFVAVGHGAQIVRSTNGTSWTVTNVSSGNQWTSICWSDELSLFVVVSETGIGNRVMTSPNGITWTNRNTTGKDYSWQSVCWSPQLGIFVAVAGMTLGENSNKCVMTSSDGINWTLRTTPVNIWSSVCWSPELSLFVAVGSASSTNAIYNGIYANYLLMTSPDGINWTSRDTSSFGNISLNNVIWAKELGRFLACSRNLGQLLTSTDGVNWSGITYDSTTTKGYYAISWAPELGQICATSGSTLSNKVLTFSSPVLHNYRNFTLNTTNKLGNINALAWSPSLNTYTGLGNGTVNLIQDSYANVSGDSLITTTIGAYLSNNWKSVAYSSSLNLFCAVASSGSGNRIMTSSDGSNWIYRTSPADNNWEKVIWVSELSLFVAVASSGSSNRVMTSPDGISWTLRTTPNNQWKSLAWSPTLPLLCAVGALTYTKPSTSYSVTNNKVAGVANDMTVVADETRITSFSTYTSVTGTGPQYYSSGGYKNKPYIKFSSIRTGVNSDFISIPSLALNMSTNGGFTLVTKVYITDMGSVSRYPIWLTTNAATYAFNMMALSFYPDSVTTNYTNNTNHAKGYFNFVIFNGGSTTTDGTQICNLNTSSTFSFNTWYTITVTTAANNGSTAEIYVDGILANSTTISAALTNRTNTINYLGLMAGIGLIVNTTSQRFTGLYDSLFVYDRLLNNTELQTIYDYIEGTSGDNNSIMTSTNGVNWTSRSTNVDSNNVMSIAWSPKLSLFVAVGNNHLGNRIIRSPDGINWTVCDVSYDYQNWKNVVWVEDLGMFYVTSTDSAYDNVLLTSTDGINWSMTYPPTDAAYTWKNFVWAQSLNELFCFGEDSTGNAAILSHTNQIQFSLANVSVSTPVYGNVSVPQYGNVLTPVYGNVVVPQYGNVLTGVYGNIITSLYGNVVIPKYDYSNSAIYGNIKVSDAYNTSNISISSNIITSNFNLTMPLYADLLSPIIGNVASPIYGNITIPEYGNIITPIYGNLVVPEYGVVYEPIYANVLVPVYGEVITPIYGNVIVPVYGQGYIPVYGNVEIPVYGNVLVPEYGFIQIPQYTEVTTPVYGNVIVPVYETQQFPIYGEEIVPIYTAVPTPIYSNIVEDVYQTIYTPIYQTSNVPIYTTITTPIYTEVITPIYGTILLPQYEEILTPIIEERITPIYQEVITPIYQEMVIPVTSYIYTPVYQDIVEPVYEDVLQPVYGKALLPVYTEVQIPIYSEVLVYVDPTAKTSSSKDIFTGSATVTNLLSFANGTVNNLFSLDSLYAPNLSLLPNPTTLATGNTTAANINVGNLIINPNYGDRVSITTLRNLSSFRNTNLTGQLVVGNISVNRNYISFASGQDFKPGNLSVDQTLFASSFVASTSNVSIQNISTLNNTSMIHVLDGANESNIRDNIIYTTNLTSNNGVSTVNLTVDGSAEVKNVGVQNDAYVSGNIYARNGNMTSNLSAEYVIATDNMFISSNVSGTFTMPRTEAGNLTIKDTVRSNNIKSSSLQDILDLHAGNISSSKLYSSIDKLREVLSKDAQDNLYLGNYVAGNIYIGGPGAIAQTIYIGSALDTIYIGGDVANVFTTDTNVKDATIVINHGGSSYSGAGVEFEGAVSGSLTLDANGKFIFNDASGNVYSLTYIADGNFANMNVNGAVLTSQNMSANVATVQKSLYNANHITAQTYENSGAMTTSTATASNTTSATLAVSSIHTSSAVAVAGTSAVSGNVIVSASTSTSSLTTSALETVDMSVLSAIQCANVAFYDFNGTNATITNGVVSASVNTHAIELHGGNLTTTNTLITKDVMLDNANISTRDATYDLRVKGSAHFGSKGSYDENNFGVFNITTSNVNPDPCISIVKEGSYVWNMGYDNASNDFVIYDGNVGVRLTAANSQSWSSVSDERFKKHIETLDEHEAMERVMKGRGVYYNYLSDAEGSQRKVGFIAQELKEILPEVVDVPEKSEDPLTVRYQEITPLLIQALKGASKEVKELKTQITAIKAKRA